MVITGLYDSAAKNDLLFDLSYHFYSIKDSSEFRYWNKRTFQLSRILQDTLGTAESHWDLGNFLYHAERIDSAFFHYKKAAHYYNIKGNNFLYARMLLNIGILQKNIKDYSSSETNTLTALKIVLPLAKTRQIYIGYNNLGILYNQLTEYRNALDYHKKALGSAQKLSDSYLIANSLNNIGVVYEKLGLYNKGIEHYIKGLEILDREDKYVRLYAMLKDNLAYSRFKLGKTEIVLSKMLEALQLREKNGHEAGIVINKLHLGEYFLAQEDTLQGKMYFLEAYELAERIHLHRDILQSLLFLSKSDKKNSKKYLEDYISLHDSLELDERRVRNKFARIELETDEFIAENEELTEERKWILGGSVSAFSICVLFFVIWRQKVNNRKLIFEKEQQKANEEIYNLISDQERKIQLGKQKEKDRISRDLHDGVLGEMYGIRFNLTNLNSRVDEPAIKTKEILLERLQKVEKNIRLISRDLQGKIEMGDTGFLNIISQLCHELPKKSGYATKLYSDKEIDWRTVRNPIKMNLYRIIQEALYNIEKYAFAKVAEISFVDCPGQLILQIKDDGKGFDVSSSTEGIGLTNMKYRVHELNGSFRIQSGQEGTEITIKIPIDE